MNAFAKGGTHETENVTLRCRAHNVLAAEQDFGRACVERAASSQRHESLVSQTRGDGGERRERGEARGARELVQETVTVDGLRPSA